VSALRGRTLLALALALFPTRALANGKFPAAGQIVVDPGDAARVLVRTTFGILSSSDGGAHFDWICETGAGYGGGYDPGIAIAAGGSILAGVPDGIRVGREGGCSFTRAAGEVDHGFVSDVSVQKGHPEKAVALRKGESGADAVWISTDSGTTWTKAGVDLPSDFSGATLDLAPSDSARLYVGGTRLTGGSFRGAVGRSKDGGSTWEVLLLPPPFETTTPYLAAVDPVDASVIYVRLDGTPGRLLVSKDAGESFSQVLQIPGFMKAFALSPDGATALAGGPSDGVWRAPTQTLAFQKVSSLAASCLAWAGERVYACADQVLVSLSTNMGSSFTPLLSIRCVRGPLSCDPATSVGAVCPAMWGPIAQQIGATSCTAQSSSGGAGPGGSGAADAGAAPADGGAGGGSGAGGEAPAASGCGGCGVGRGGVSASRPIGALALAWLLARIRRAPHRPRRSIRSSFRASVSGATG
jgi:hypothetical protein